MKKSALERDNVGERIVYLKNEISVGVCMCIGCHIYLGKGEIFCFTLC